MLATRLDLLTLALLHEKVPFSLIALDSIIPFCILDLKSKYCLCACITFNILLIKSAFKRVYLRAIELCGL